MKHIRAIADVWLELWLRVFFRVIWCCASPERRQQYDRIGRKNVVLYFVMQRVLRINSHVPWPTHWSSIVVCPENIRLACDRPWPGFATGQYIQAINGISIGRNVRLGPGVKLISANHNVNDYENHIPATPIIIGDNVWLGADVKVTAGVTIGNHVVVGAGAVVTKHVPANTLVAGVPARVIRQLDEYGCATMLSRTAPPLDPNESESP